MKPEKRSGPEMLSKEQLREKLNLPSVKAVQELMNARKISFLRLGHRTVRFDWEKVQRELARLEVKAVGS